MITNMAKPAKGKSKLPSACFTTCEMQVMVDHLKLSIVVPSELKWDHIDENIMPYNCIMYPIQGASGDVPFVNIIDISISGSDGDKILVCTSDGIMEWTKISAFGSMDKDGQNILLEFEYDPSYIDTSLDGSFECVMYLDPTYPNE